MDRRRITSFDGTALTVYEGGTPDGPPMVLLNGLGGNVGSWAPVIQHFQDRFRMISWDYRGLYRSGPAPIRAAYSIRHHAEDLAVVLRATHAQAPLLIGWSMGVQVGLEFHRRYPQSAAAFVALNGTPGHPFRTAFHSNSLHGRFEGIFAGIHAHWRKVWRFRRLFVRPSIIHAFTGAILAAGLAAPQLNRHLFGQLVWDFVDLDVGAYADLFAALGRHSAEDLLPHIHTPTLVITGTADRFTPAERSRHMVDTLPNAELHVLPGATHFAPVEFPDAINRRLDTFVASQNLLERPLAPRVASVAF